VTPKHQRPSTALLLWSKSDSTLTLAHQVPPTACLRWQ